MGQWGRIWKKALNQFKENGILFKMTPQPLLLMAALIWNPRNAGKTLLWEIYIEMRSNIFGSTLQVTWIENRKNGSISPKTHISCSK